MWYVRLCEFVYSAIVPEEWNKGMIIPIYKNGDVQSPSNYRPITLLSSIGKLFTKILSKRITEWAEDHALLTEAQFGFRPTYSTTDANYTLYSLVNSIRKKKNCIVHLLTFQQHLIQSTETYYMIVSQNLV